ncbi:MAG: hypothetical protein AB9869_30220 [Verrucomicrobiia bacterium]
MNSSKRSKAELTASEYASISVHSEYGGEINMDMAECQIGALPGCHSKPQNPFARLVTKGNSEHRCPACGSIIYSRRHRLCGVCSQPLPNEFLFTASEARQVKALLEAERARHRQWCSRLLGSMNCR